MSSRLPSLLPDLATHWPGGRRLARCSANLISLFRTHLHTVRARASVSTTTNVWFNQSTRAHRSHRKEMSNCCHSIAFRVFSSHHFTIFIFCFFLGIVFSIETGSAVVRLCPLPIMRSYESGFACSTLWCRWRSNLKNEIERVPFDRFFGSISSDEAKLHGHVSSHVMKLLVYISVFSASCRHWHWLSHWFIEIEQNDSSRATERDSCVVCIVCVPYVRFEDRSEGVRWQNETKNQPETEIRNCNWNNLRSMPTKCVRCSPTFYHLFHACSRSVRLLFLDLYRQQCLCKSSEEISVDSRNCRC